MRPLAFQFPYFVLFAAVFLWAFAGESRIIRKARRAVADRSTPHDRGSLQVVMLTQFAGLFAAFAFAWSGVGHIAAQRVAFWLGMIVYTAGAVLRRVCFRALGESFTGEVRVRQEQRVVMNGPYRFVRHPSYTAGLMMVVGVALTLGNWLGALIGVALAAIGYMYRVHVEEHALAETLGEPYRDYMARTTRFIPFVL